MIELTAVDLAPLDAFPLRWRWTDPRWNLLPRDALATIRPLVPAKVAELARDVAPAARGLWDLGNAGSRRMPQALPAPFDGTMRLATSTPEPALVVHWLRAQVADEDALVAVLWDSRAVLTTWRVFAAYWDDFCYPSGDDVTIAPASGAWLLVYHHEEVFVFGRYRVVAPLFRMA